MASKELPKPQKAKNSRAAPAPESLVSITAPRFRTSNQAMIKLFRMVGQDSAADRPATTQVASLPQPKLQTKITINQPGDVHEKEADRVASEVMRMPEEAVPVTAGKPSATVRRKCGACDHEDLKIAQRSLTGKSPGQAPAIVDQVLSQPGRQLPQSTRMFFESRMGADFSAVRLHDDTQAAQSAEAVSAQAYTVGNHIVLAEGKFATGTSQGRYLLAHELAHVEQNRPGRASENAGDLHRQADPQAPTTPVSAEDPNQPSLCGPGTPNPFCLPVPKRPCAPDQKDGTRPCTSPSLVPDRFEPCMPYADEVAALNSWVSMKLVVPNAMAVSTQCGVVKEVWDAYLDRTSKAFSFTGSSCVVKAAKDNAGGSATANASAQGFMGAIFDNLPFLLRRIVPPGIPLGGPVGELRLTLADALNRDPGDPSFHPMIEYDNAAFNAAGNLAGGVGVSGQGSDVFGDDDRVMSGPVLIQVMGIDPATGMMIGTVRYQPHVHVKDTVDFCPGNLGSSIAQSVTVPLSKLEASGLAKDVPITIDYDLDVLEAPFSVTPVVGPLPGPKPVPTPTPEPPQTPVSEPAPIPTEYIVQPGDYLRRIAKRFYGNENLWQRIYDANQQVIGNDPNLILPGQRLVIPL
jgi:hypothetical protein